jgi:hypothetical protein
MNSKIFPLLRLVVGLMLIVGFSARAQYTQITSGGWFVRGTGSNLSYKTLVIPLDGQQGVLGGPSLTNLYNNIYAGTTNLYHYNATNTLSQNVLTNRIKITGMAAAPCTWVRTTTLAFTAAIGIVHIIMKHWS